MAKKTPEKPKSKSKFTSIYLDDDSRAKLDEIQKRTGQNRSEAVRGLIQSADAGVQTQVKELVGDLADLLHLR